MHVDHTLIEPTLAIHDMGRKVVSTTASPTISKALRDEARSDLDDAISRIKVAPPAASLTWEQLNDMEIVLDRASGALHTIRATTAAPQED
jgi:hypothetical protein